jgi:hypothetical protein
MAFGITWRPSSVVVRPSIRPSYVVNFTPLFSIFSLAAILVRSRDQRTQFWKRAIQIPFNQSLVAIGPVVSEEKIKVYDVRRTDGRTDDDGRRTPSKDGRQAKNRKKGG